MKVIAFDRQTKGTGASRRLRRTAKTPGIVYGAGLAPKSIELDHNGLFHALRKESFHSSILELEINEKSEKVLLRDFQMHPFKQLVLHVDFQRVDPNTKINIKVPLHFINEEISPAVKVSGGLISHVMNDINIQCLPADLPEFVEVDLVDFQLNQSIHAKDLKLPKGVTLVPYVEQENPVLVTVSLPSSSSVEATPAATPAAGA